MYMSTLYYLHNNCKSINVSHFFTFITKESNSRGWRTIKTNHPLLLTSHPLSWQNWGLPHCLDGNKDGITQVVKGRWSKQLCHDWTVVALQTLRWVYAVTRSHKISMAIDILIGEDLGLWNEDSEVQSGVIKTRSNSNLTSDKLVCFKKATY